MRMVWELLLRIGADVTRVKRSSDTLCVIKVVPRVIRPLIGRFFIYKGGYG